MVGPDSPKDVTYCSSTRTFPPSSFALLYKALLAASTDRDTSAGPPNFGTANVFRSLCATSAIGKTVASWRTACVLAGPDAQSVALELELFDL